MAEYEDEVKRKVISMVCEAVKTRCDNLTLVWPNHRYIRKGEGIVMRAGSSRVSVVGLPDSDAKIFVAGRCFSVRVKEVNVGIR